MTEEKKRKLENYIRKIQNEAAKMDAARTAAEKRKAFSKMVEEERARQDAKRRTFANPQNADEATGEMPTLEQLSNGNPDLHPDGWRWKSKDEILGSGTLLEKLRLYFSSEDLSGYFGTNGALTEQERANIVASIRTNEDRKIVQQCYKEYYTLIDYGNELRFYFKRFQTTYAMLATLLNKWDDYENTAKQLTNIYQMMESTRFSITPHGEEEAPLEKWDKLYSSVEIETWLSKQEKQNVFFNGAELKFNKGVFWVDIEKGGIGLYSDVEKESKETAEALADFKAFFVAIDEFIKKSKLRFMPISIQMSIENAEEERYTRYLVKNLSFFRSELNLRKEKGESITPEEEKRAVIPDYYEVTPTKEIYDSCSIYIKQLMKRDRWQK